MRPLADLTPEDFFESRAHTLHILRLGYARTTCRAMRPVTRKPCVSDGTLRPRGRDTRLGAEAGEVETSSCRSASRTSERTQPPSHLDAPFMRAHEAIAGALHEAQVLRCHEHEHEHRAPYDGTHLEEHLEVAPTVHGIEPECNRQRCVRQTGRRADK